MSPPASSHDQWADRMHEHAEAQARMLHDVLNIRPDQEDAFQAMMATMTPPDAHGGMDMHDDRDSSTPMTTPQRLDEMAARMAERQAQFQRHADAVRRFYGVLSPGQQRAFDALQGMMMMGHHGMMGGGMKDGHGHGDDD